MTNIFDIPRRCVFFVCYSGTRLLIRSNSLLNKPTTEKEKSEHDYRIFYRNISLLFFKLEITSHNSRILHKQSHAFLCSSFEQWMDFYSMKKRKFKIV